MLAFAVRTAPSGAAVGMAELQPAADGAARISYAIAPAWCRRGFAARAVLLLAVAGLERFGYDRIELRCDVDNLASARTAERAGFVFERIDPAGGVYEHVEGWSDAPRGERVYAVERLPSGG